MKRKILIMFAFMLLFSVASVLPAYALCDDCIDSEAQYDWRDHCDAYCECSWGPCGYCGDNGTYLEDFCGNSHVYTSRIVSEPSCTSTGVINYSCACGESYNSTIPPLQHEYTVNTIPPTCEEGGYTYHVCNRCGYSYTTDSKPATGHSWSEVDREDPTCTVTGKKYLQCTCGETTTEKLAAAGHSYETNTIAPTCENEGYTYHLCSICGDSYTSASKPAIGHDWDEVDREDSTCITQGTKYLECTRCGETTTEKIAAMGHDYETNTIAPSCVEDGYTYHLCKRCDHSYTSAPKPATGHSWSQKRVVHATCTTSGQIDYECFCGETDIDLLAALGHDFCETDVISPTCMQGGYTIKGCSRCSEFEVVTGSETDPIDHEWATMEVNQPDCDDSGSITYWCRQCGDTYSEFIDELGHNYVDFVCTRCGYSTLCDHSYQLIETTQSTCTKKGQQLFECSLCGETYSKTLSLKSHSYVATTHAPSCDAQGYTVHACSVCGHSYQDAIVAATGHSFKETSTTPSTCIVAGQINYACACGETKVENLPLGDHNFVDGTCTVCGALFCNHLWINDRQEGDVCVNGVTVYRHCENCSQTSEVFFKPEGHAWKESGHNKQTCTNAGYDLYICEVCQVKDYKNHVDPLGHQFVNGLCTFCGIGNSDASQPNESTPGEVLPNEPDEDADRDFVDIIPIDSDADLMDMLLKLSFMFGGTFLILLVFTPDSKKRRKRRHKR